MTFPRHFDCTYVNTQKYEFRTISGRSTISGRRAIGASFSWGLECVCFLTLEIPDFGSLFRDPGRRFDTQKNFVKKKVC